ncbi:tetratricopeptide repeat protein [Streptomyces sp. 4F14]|uniref:tetratricopeptide repeat protein n=1 Tax=Streptomyces sp. 4F14 TaxID=3394380 RepID=UPI003A839E16
MLRRRRGRDIASLVTEIRETGDTATVLDSTSPGTDLYGRSLALRPVLETSYHRLPPELSRLLRLLCLAPAAEVGTGAVAALADLDERTVLPMLENLAARYLVTAVRGGERWHTHDLVRAYGASLAVGDPEEDLARAGLLKFHLERAFAAYCWLTRLPGHETPEFFADLREALEWLDIERTGLVATVGWVPDGEFMQAAVDLAGWLAPYLGRRRYFDDALTVAYAALDAAERLEDPVSLTLSWDKLGVALAQMDRLEDAIEAHVQARNLSRATEDRQGEAMASNNLSITLAKADRLDEAIDAAVQARELYRKTGNRQGEGMAWNNLGAALRQAGRLDEAIDAHTRARDLYQEIGARHREAFAWNNLGSALYRAGRFEKALHAFGESLKARRGFEDWYGEGGIHMHLARTHTRLDRPAEARASYLRAVEAFTLARSPDDVAQAHAEAARLPL